MLSVCALSLEEGKGKIYPSFAAFFNALSFSSHVPGFPFSPIFLEIDVLSAPRCFADAWT
jgi:hypothetical protein